MRQLIEPLCRLSGSRWLVLVLALASVLAPRSAAAQTTGVNGFVVDTLGNRISGASVSVISGPATGRRTTSGTDGFYTLSNLNPGNYTFAAEATGYTRTTRNANVVSGSTTRVDFSLPAQTTQGGVLTGVVNNSRTGQPVSGALVTLDGSAGNPDSTQTTAANGVYRFTNLPTGVYRVTVSREGFNNAGRNVTVRANQQVTANFSLGLRAADLGIVEGTVTDDTGRTIRNARVRLVGGASGGLFDDANGSGFYRITNVVPDTYDLEVTATGYNTERVTGVLVSQGQRVTANVTLVAIGATTAAVEGFVVDNFGTAIRGARVAITSGPVTGRFDVTDGTGAFEIGNLPGGTYTFVASATGYDNASRTVTLTADETTRLDFSLPSNVGQDVGTISGTVTLSSGDGVADVRVRITAGPTFGQTTLTDEDGDYAFGNLPPGTYTLVFSRAGFEDKTVNNIAVTAAETTMVDVELGEVTNGGTLTGLLRDTSGNPLNAVNVTITRDDEEIATATTNSAGRFTVSGLAAGTYEAVFSKSGFQTTTVSNIVITAGNTTEITVRLSPSSGGGTGTINGIARDTAGRSIQNALVELTGPAGSRSTRTDANGRFTFTNLPAGSGYSVTVTASGLTPSTQSNLTVANGGTLNLTFTLTQQGGASGIAGTVRNSAGFPLVGATVTLVSGPYTGARQATGSDGRFNFPGIPAGTYVVEARLNGFQVVRKQALVRAGGSAFLTFYLPRTTATSR